MLTSETHRRFDEAQLLFRLLLLERFFFEKTELEVGVENFSSRKVIAQLFGNRNRPLMRFLLFAARQSRKKGNSQITALRVWAHLFIRLY